MKTSLYFNPIVIFIVAFLAAFASTTHSAQLVVDPHATEISLTPHYSFFVDETNTLTIDDITQFTSGEFKPLFNPTANMGTPSGTHWFTFSLRNLQSIELNRLLRFDYPLLDQLDVYVFDDKQQPVLVYENTGDSYPFSQRPRVDTQFVFPISIPKDATLTFYFKIKTAGNLVASANLWAEPEFNQRKRAESFVLDVYFGLLLSLMGFNLVLYFTIKEYRYLYYVALAASMFFCAGSFNGLWFQLLWPTWPNWHQISVPIGFCSVGITAILFSRSFLQTQVETPKLDKLLLLIALGFTGIIIASPFTNLSLIINLSSIAAIAMAVVALSAGIVVALKNKDYAWLYVIAWLSLLLGTIIFSAQVTGWIHSSTLTRYAIFIGSTVEMILLSFALTLQINYFKDQVTESQSIALAANRKLIAFLKDNEKELSERVYERTQALDEANQHLREQETILTKLAHYDELTEVANRSFLTEQFKHLLARAKRDEFSFAIFFLDLNYFKTINDTYGHKTGDELLIHTARQLRQTLRESDIVGRLGGDEFLILVEIKPEDANLAVLIEKIKLAIASPITINEQEYITSVSIGVAQYPIDGDEIDTLMNIADKRMYQDKRRIKLGKSSPING